ncbi:hypothetical protein VNO77_18549 [Canavalia gladiata]|uniref:Uncharacterized protein n=1 Tax=Canavalia gladiata TaxID=3824 RepID=A0AAN9QHT0_CANGL
MNSKFFVHGSLWPGPEWPKLSPYDFELDLGQFKFSLSQPVHFSLFEKILPPQIGWTGYCLETHDSGSALNSNFAPEKGEIPSLAMECVGQATTTIFRPGGDIHWDHYCGIFVACTNVHVK